MIKLEITHGCYEETVTANRENLETLEHEDLINIGKSLISKIDRDSLLMLISEIMQVAKGYTSEDLGTCETCSEYCFKGEIDLVD